MSGIYYIFDQRRRLGYVRSATGEDSLFGRWRDYVRTGHGGNVERRASRPEDFRFSILQLTPGLYPNEVVRLEQTWMRRLSTRECGLNGRQRRSEDDGIEPS